MEDIFEQISKLIKKIWLQPDLILDPKNWEAPVLILTLVSLGLVLYIIYKIKQAHANKEDRLDELLNELDDQENSDKEVTDNLISPDLESQPAASDSDNEPYMSSVGKLEEKETEDEEERDDNLHPIYLGGERVIEEPAENIYGDEFESPTFPKEAVTSDDTDDLNAPPGEPESEPEKEKIRSTDLFELTEDDIDEDMLKDQPTLDLKEETEEAETNALIESLNSFQEQLETRFHDLELELETEREKPATQPPFDHEQSTHRPTNVQHQSENKARSKKEYQELLESFIFKAK